MKRIEMIIEVLLAVIFSPLYFISYLVPKQKGLWVFGSSFGRNYADNSRYLFEHINRTDPEIRAVWISSRKAVVKQVRDKGYEAYLGYSLPGIYLMLRSSAGIISHSKIRDLKPFVLCSSSRLIMLWHGIPLKKIGCDDKLFYSKDSFIKQLEFRMLGFVCPAHRRRCDLAIAASDEDRKSFSRALGIPPENIRITGYPRNDVILKGRKSLTGKHKKVNGVYMPTFRGKEGEKFSLAYGIEKDLGRIMEYLKGKDVCLHIKLHPFNSLSPGLIKIIDASENLNIMKAPDIYEILNAFDFLITDYSSIYFDYLLLNRPVIFSPFDMDEYLRTGREFYYPYDEVTPGPKAYSWEEITGCMESILSDIGLYEEERMRLRKRFHRYVDAGSCSRVLDEIKKIV